MKTERVTIAKILKPQGLRGEVKAEIFIAGAYLNGLKSVCLEGGTPSEGDTRAANVTSVSVREGFAYFLFEGVSDRAAAERLRGKTLSAPRSALRLKKDEYLRSDLIGLKLLDETGLEYGTVTAVDSFGAADVYTVCNGEKVMRFPFIKKLAAGIDTAAKTMTVNAAALAEVAVYDAE